MNSGFWILDSGFWFLVSGFWILDSRFWFQYSGFWILDAGFWFLDSGFSFLVSGGGTLADDQKYVERSRGAGAGGTRPGRRWYLRLGEPLGASWGNPAGWLWLPGL